MRKKINILSIILSVIVLLSVSSCTMDKIDESQSSFLPQFPTLSSIIEEDTIYDSIQEEEIESENLLIEQLLIENTINEVYSLEVLQREDVTLEHISIEVSDNFEDLEYYMNQCEFGIYLENDFSMSKYYFKEGMKIILAEAVVDVAGCLISIVCQNYIEAGKQLVDLAIMVGTATFSAFVEGIINSKLSAEAGNDVDTIICDALTGAAKGFYYATVATELFLTLKEIVNLFGMGLNVYKNIKAKNKKIPTSDGGYIKSGKYYDSQGSEYSINSFGEIYNGDNYYKTIDNFSDLDVDNLSIVNISKNSLYTGDVVSQRGVKKGYIDYDNNEKIYTYQEYAKKTNSANNEAAYELKGDKIPIDENGWLYKKNAYGDLVPTDKISLNGNNRGSKVAELHKATDKGITFDREFNITNKKEIVGNKEIIYSNADSDKPIAYKNLDTNYLFDYNTKNVIGYEAGGGNFNVTWQMELNAARKQGTTNYRKIVYKLLKDYPESRVYFKNVFTDSQIDNIIKTGKFPDGFEVHHVKNVAQNPTYASDVNIMEFLTREDHKNKGHGGDFRNSGRPTENFFNIESVLQKFNLKLSDLIN